MSLKITPPTEPIATTTLCVTIFGQPGIGKSSLAFSAPKPLLLDFDGGAQRALGRKEIVRVSAWSDVADIAAADVAPYETVVLDTVGRALEFLAADLVSGPRGNPKLARSTGELSMQGYGALKMAFAQWLGRVRTFGKHIILIAHEREERDGDNTIIRVDAMGATRVEVIRLSDLVGFMASVNGRRTLEFSPTDKHTGKNCAGFDPLVIPHLSQEPDWLGKVMAEALKRMNALTEAQKEREEEIKQWMAVIDNLADVEAVNATIRELPSNDQLIRDAFAKHAKSLGLKWNGKAFVTNGASHDVAA